MATRKPMNGTCSKSSSHCSCVPKPCALTASQRQRSCDVPADGKARPWWSCGGDAPSERRRSKSANTPLMFGVGIGHNAKRRIERQLIFQRLAESNHARGTTGHTSHSMPPVAPIALVAPWWRHRVRGAARYTPFAGLPAAEQAWRGARAVICRTHPSGELWPRTAGLSF